LRFSIPPVALPAAPIAPEPFSMDLFDEDEEVDLFSEDEREKTGAECNRYFETCMIVRSLS